MRRTASRPRGVRPALSGLAANRRRTSPARAAFTQRKSPFPRRSRHASRPRGIHEKRSCAYSRIMFSLSGAASVSGGGFSRSCAAPPLARAAFTLRYQGLQQIAAAHRPRGVHEKRSCAYSRIIFSLSGAASVPGGGFSRHAPHRLSPAQRSREALMRIQPHNIFPLRRGQRVRRGIFAPRSQIFCRRRRMYAYSTHIVTRRSADSCAASSTEARRLFIYGSVFRKSSA